MRKKFLMGLVIGLLLFGIAGVGNALTIDINAITNTTSNPVSVYFEAGTYDVTPFENTYTAWTAWYNAAKGWLNSYSLSSDEFAAYTVTDGLHHATADLALLNAVSTSFTLAAAGDVNFFITDSPYYDNSGGISLEVTRASASVPEPATIFLLGTGLIGLSGLGRKRFLKK